MKQIPAFLITCVLGCFVTRAQTLPAILFQQTFGGTNDDQLTCMTPTGDGGFLLGGYSASGPSGNKSATNFGNNDYWIVKLDGTGTKQWDRSYGGSSQDELTAILPTSDGGYLLGGTSGSGVEGNKTATNHGVSDYWVVKIDSNGNKQWDQSYGGSDQEVFTSMVATKDGGYLLGGFSFSPSDGNKAATNFGTIMVPASAYPMPDYWIVRIDSNGNRLWDQSYGGNNSDELWTILATSDGGYLLGGVSSSGTNGNKSVPSFGDSGLSDPGDAWLVKVDANGNKQWDKVYGGTGGDMCNSLLASGDGGYLFGGGSSSPPSGNKTSANFGTTPDYWVVKLDGAGNIQWDQTYGGTGWETLSRVLPTTDGGYLLSGSSASAPGGNKSAPNRGSNDVWVVKIDANGNKQWDQTYGGSGNDGPSSYFVSGLLQTTNNDFWLGATSGSGMDGNKTAPNLGGSDFWLLKIAGSVPPVITAQPQGGSVCAGGTITFSVAAFSTASPRYQWRFNGADIAGATNSSVTLTNVKIANAGNYSVVISNDYGSIDSHPVILTYTDAATVVLGLHPSLAIYGTPGKTYRIDYSEDVNGPVTWTTLTNVTLATTPQVWVDVSQPIGSSRFYRVVLP
ncbi:MAG: immunoglobulin domain-containing protein [Limisphaerales bacterium]